MTTKPDHRGDHVISRNTIARGMPGETGVTVVTTLVCLLFFARETAGASSARHSLRPLNFRWLYTMQNSRVSRGEIAEVWVRGGIADASDAASYPSHLWGVA